MPRAGAADHPVCAGLGAARLTPRARDAGLAPEIEEIALGLTGTISPKVRTFDLIPLLHPVPVRIIARLLGVPEEDVADFCAGQRIWLRSIRFWPHPGDRRVLPITPPPISPPFLRRVCRRASVKTA